MCDRSIQIQLPTRFGKYTVFAASHRSSKLTPKPRVRARPNLWLCLGRLLLIRCLHGKNFVSFGPTLDSTERVRGFYVGVQRKNFAMVHLQELLSGRSNVAGAVDCSNDSSCKVDLIWLSCFEREIKVLRELWNLCLKWLLCESWLSNEVDRRLTDVTVWNMLIWA